MARSSEFEDHLLALASKVRDQGGAIQTEEATKNAFVMPFISTVLGYDVFNPLEVVPEFTADVGLKKGEKVDYAIMSGGEVQILIECKKSAEPLRIEHAAQLFRYFSVTNARIAILTNGQVYQLFTDLDAPNKMDNRPFMVLDLLELDATLLPELHKLAKANFDLNSVLSAAGELKYIGSIKRIIAAEFKDPGDEWLRFFVSRAYEGSITQRVRDQFKPLVSKALQQFLSDQVNDRLKSAMSPTALPALPSSTLADDSTNESAPLAQDNLAKASEVETTEEELEGYHIVKAIACSEVPPERVVHRDAKSYFAVLLDNNNRKSICRLYFNRAQHKYIGLFDEAKVETRHPIGSVEEIYRHAETIRASTRQHAGTAS